MHRASQVLLTLFSLCSCALGLDISESCKSGELWNQPAQTVLQGASYSQPDDDHLRTSQLTIGSLTLGEVIVNLNEGKATSMQAMLYNKGDDGTIGAEAFNTILSNTKDALNAFTGVKGKLRAGGKQGAAIKLKTWEWKWENGIIRLEANSSGKNKDFQAEFIRLNMASNAKILSSGGANDSISRRELRDSITTEEDGTVWLKNVPMVDQGDKGYCVPATLARIFAFYGMDKVDQHTLADLCDSSGSGGTSSRDMELAMETICKKFRTKFIILEDYATTLKSFIGPYNKLAKREKKATLDIYSNVFDLADASILRQVRAGKKNQVSKWMRDIKKNIDSGTPVIWMVTVGIYPEEISLPQNRGGHARLIIGYNLKTNSIIYTDSWGAMHARKTMPAADAIGMTTGRYIIKLR